MVKAPETLHADFDNILTYFQHRWTKADAEGLNGKIQMVNEIAFGFRDREH